ncbi:hypothetical protein I6E17_00645 [Fusobacterium perfoetens]|uniref:hypothetical protein n=1 Tax=Fusobacterium perfoetens TaxID=852 RepID=UPI0015A0A498|nr:hypothetical protein [Fusobacterium perfoetens]MCF2624686.1 hypothetical protein [Fusobacterium perfoetens]
MNIDELTQELDRIMLEEGYIEISDKNNMVTSLIEEHNANMKLYKKAIGHLYSSYSYFENDDETFFYNPYDSFDNLEEFKKEFNIL